LVERSGPSVLVVHADELVVALADDSQDGDIARTGLRGEQLTAPDLVGLEVLSVLRRAPCLGAPRPSAGRTRALLI
jgi:predicted nucleic acid-binding protein